MMSWQPIETAPLDGTAVLLWERNETEPVVGWWSVKRGRWFASTTFYDTDGDACVVDRLDSEDVTHWMPLPLPPEGDKL